jgi:hypothetical protein
MAKKAKGGNALTYNVTLYQTGVQRLDGEIVSNSDGIVIVKHKKGEGSSAFVQSMIAVDSIVGIDGAPGKPGSVMYNGRTVAWRAKRATVEPGKNGMVSVKWTNSAGREFNMNIRAADAEIVSSGTVDRPEGAAPKKKKDKKKDKKDKG